MWSHVLFLSAQAIRMFDCDDVAVNADVAAFLKPGQRTRHPLSGRADNHRELLVRDAPVYDEFSSISMAVDRGQDQ